jgi:murein DD-endopeptidase MepM/ murein hydrolase activator NlpD
MGTRGCGRRRWRAAAASLLLAGFLADCSPSTGPAPVVARPPQPATITIERGQTLSGIAYAYHVPMRELAEANHLSSPDRILAGGKLVIPAAGAAPLEEAMPTAAATPAAVGAVPPVAIAALPPQSSAPAASAVPAPTRPPATSSEAAPPATLTPPLPTPPPETARSAELTPPQRAGPPLSSAESTPTQRPPKPLVPPVANPNPASQPAGVTSAVPSARPSDTFLWPVHGHVVEGFGAGPDGTHNDGINIAAPRGSPIQAVDGGVVAYAGNELRGYGNLILIKHPDGWISAYAHCDLILVKHGQRVARGQVIARVGATGNVSTPQLHFELRRGDKPVDPRTHLAPLPSAVAVPASSG